MSNPIQVIRVGPKACVLVYSPGGTVTSDGKEVSCGSFARMASEAIGNALGITAVAVPEFLSIVIVEQGAE